MLDEPAGKVLAAFRDHQDAVSAWFVGAGALRRAARSDRDRRRTPVVARGRCGSRCRSGSRRPSCRSIGLLRWPILVPGYASDAASGNAGVAATPATRSRPRATSSARPSARPLGYLLTATWTVLVVVALGRRYAGRWFQVLGAASAVLVFVGVLSPLGLPVIDTANFFGYVLWSVWLIAFAVVILVHERRTPPRRPRPRRPAAVTT